MEKTCILIIEDNADIRGSTSEILSLAGYDVYQASNGKQGVEQAIKQMPDLILCDIMMPEMDGYGVFRMLRTREETSLIPIIFITAKTERADVRKGMEAGADDYLTKPYDEVELLQAIETRLSRRAHQKRVYSTSLKQLDSLFAGSHGLDELKQAFSERKVKHIRKKQVIYYEGESPNAIYLILTGSVKTLKLAEDGRELLLAVYGVDDYFGITALLAGEEYKETAEALEDCTLCSLPKDIVDQFVYKYPGVAERFIKILAGNLSQYQEQLLQLAYHSVRKRLAELLVRLNVKDSSLKSLELSRDNLASMAGIAAETVSRILSDFKDEKLIEKSAGKIVILDAARLERLKN